MKEVVSDVVVVGSGAAGLTAALAASLGGANVTVLEKSSLFGGTTAISGGGMWLPANRLAREAGVEDSVEKAKEYLTRLTTGETAEDVIDAFVETAPEVLEFLLQNTALDLYADTERPDYQSDLPGAVDAGRLVGVNLYDTARLGEYADLVRQPMWFGGLVEPLLHFEMRDFLEKGDPEGWLPLAQSRLDSGIVLRGCGLICGLLEACLTSGVSAIRNAEVMELVIADGRVKGVIAEQDGERQTYFAKRGVVLASGGFEWDATAWADLMGVPLDQPMSPKGDNDGAALRMAEQAGARLGNLNEAWWFTVGGGTPGSIVVNRDGKRFMNECMNYGDYPKPVLEFDAATYDRPNYPAYIISGTKPTIVNDDLENQSQQIGNFGLWEAETLPDLARLIGVDPDGLRDTVERFDEAAAQGIDPDFQRGEKSIDRYRAFSAELKNPTLAPLGHGPYYAQKLVLRAFGTKGGGVINTNAQVVAHNGQAIPGLYGAGNAIASPMGRSYPGGGGTLGPAVVFGYRAGLALMAQP